MAGWAGSADDPACLVRPAPVRDWTRDPGPPPVPSAVQVGRTRPLATFRASGECSSLLAQWAACRGPTALAPRCLATWAPRVQDGAQHPTAGRQPPAALSPRHAQVCRAEGPCLQGLPASVAGAREGAGTWAWQGGDIRETKGRLSLQVAGLLGGTAPPARPRPLSASRPARPLPPAHSGLFFGNR